MDNEKFYPKDAVMEFLLHYDGDDRAFLYAAGDSENGSTCVGMGDVDTVITLLFMLVRNIAQRLDVRVITMLQQLNDLQEFAEGLENGCETEAEDEE